jgi:ribosomal protein L32
MHSWQFLGSSILRHRICSESIQTRKRKIIEHRSSSVYVIHKARLEREARFSE